MNNAQTRRTGIALLAAIGLSFGSLANAAGDSDKEGKRTLSPETTHGNESTIGNSKPGSSGGGASQGSRNTSPPKGAHREDPRLKDSATPTSAAAAAAPGRCCRVGSRPINRVRPGEPTAWAG